MNTGTPMSEKDSAITFMVIVLPVPVAPAMSPWRFAILGSRKRFLSDCASHIFLSLYMPLPPFMFSPDSGGSNLNILNISYPPHGGKCIFVSCQSGADGI